MWLWIGWHFFYHTGSQILFEMFKIAAFSNSQIEFDLENEENLKMGLYGSSDEENFIWSD